MRLLSNADRALGRLDGATEILPNPDLFVIMYVRKEAVLSSQIEGTQASLIDVLEFEAKAVEVNNPEDVAEVMNYQAAMRRGLARLSEIPLSLRLIREIHSSLMTGVRGSERAPGEFRRSQNWIGPAGCSLSSARFVPPPPADMEVALGDWEKFLHQEDSLPFLIKAGLAHAQFETIHPFLDGNGRMGRLLITFFMCEKGIIQRPLLYLSHFFKLHRNEYYEHLQATRDRGEWEGWIKFFLTGVAEVAQQATQTASKIRQAPRSAPGIGIRQAGQERGQRAGVLESLYLQPVTTVRNASGTLKLSFANANKLIRQFGEMELLKESTGRRRNRIFLYKSYLDLF